MHYCSARSHAIQCLHQHHISHALPPIQTDFVPTWSSPRSTTTRPTTFASHTRWSIMEHDVHHLTWPSPRRSHCPLPTAVFLSTPALDPTDNSHPTPAPLLTTHNHRRVIPSPFGHTQPRTLSTTPRHLCTRSRHILDVHPMDGITRPTCGLPPSALLTAST